MTERADTAAVPTCWCRPPAGAKAGTLTNSERRTSRQRAFLPAPGAARPDWRALAHVGRRLGWPEAFAWRGPAAIFREHAALSAHAAALGRDFDIGGLALLDDTAYKAMVPVQWPVGAPQPAHRPALRREPLRRRQDTGHRSPAELVAVTAAGCRAILRALVTDRISPGTVFVPIHWTDQTASSARIGALLPAATDPHSGQPALKAGAVELARYFCRLGRLRREPQTPGARDRLLGSRPHRPRLAGRARRRGRAERLGGLGPQRLCRAPGRDRCLDRPEPRPPADGADRRRRSRRRALHRAQAVDSPDRPSPHGTGQLAQLAPADRLD